MHHSLKIRKREELVFASHTLQAYECSKTFQFLWANDLKMTEYITQTYDYTERNYGITELEALGVVWEVKHFRQYLYGHK